jgi:hypothetical protein
MDRPQKPKSDDLIQTPEELKNTAESFTDLPKELQISAEELEMVQEQVHGKPMRYGTPAQAIEAMKARLKILNQQKSKTLSALETCEVEHLRKSLTEDLEKLIQEIAATQTRLDSYKFQRQQEN